MSKKTSNTPKTLSLNRNVIRNRIDLSSLKKDNVQGQKTKEVIAIRNEMMNEIVQKCKGEKVEIVANQKQKVELAVNNDLATEMLLIPIDDKGQNVMYRAQVAKYLVIYPGCIHFKIHAYTSHNEVRLQNDGVKYIKMNGYGADFPIVSSCNLVRCQVCIPDDHELLKMSQPRGSLNFYCTNDSNEETKHVVVPSHVNSKSIIFQDGDIVWVNLSHRDAKVKNVNELKDYIVAQTGRKNYNLVFALSYPYADFSLQFEDFGTIVHLAGTSKGYQDEGFVINYDMDEDDNFSDLSSDEYEGNVTRNVLDLSALKVTTVVTPTTSVVTSVISKKSMPIDTNIPLNLDKIALNQPEDQIHNVIPIVNNQSNVVTTDENDVILTNHVLNIDVKDAFFEDEQIQGPSAPRSSYADKAINDNDNDTATLLHDVVTKIGSLSDGDDKSSINSRLLAHDPPLKLCLSTKEEFESNHQYFMNKGLQASFISYSDKLTVTIISSEAIGLDALYDELLDMSYVIVDCQTTTVLHNDVVRSSTTFTIKSIPDDISSTDYGSDVNSVITKDDTIIEHKSPIDVALTAALSDNPDPYVAPITMLLEMTYFKAIANRAILTDKSKIYFHYTMMSKCIGIRDVDYRIYEKTSTYGVFDHNMDTDNRTVVSVLTHLKYISQIPTSKIIPDAEGIMILLD